MVLRAEALQAVACGIVLAEFSDYSLHQDELREDGHLFSRHFRLTERCQDLPYPEQTDSQQMIPQHDQQFGTQSLPQYSFASSDMNAREQSTATGWWPGIGQPGLHETTVNHMLPSNNVQNVYRDAAATGYSTNDEWERMEQELFTRYGGYPSLT